MFYCLLVTSLYPNVVEEFTAINKSQIIGFCFDLGYFTCNWFWSMFEIKSIITLYLKLLEYYKSSWTKEFVSKCLTVLLFFVLG